MCIENEISWWCKEALTADFSIAISSSRIRIVVVIDRRDDVRRDHVTARFRQVDCGRRRRGGRRGDRHLNADSVSDGHNPHITNGAHSHLVVRYIPGRRATYVIFLPIVVLQMLRNQRHSLNIRGVIQGEMRPMVLLLRLRRFQRRPWRGIPEETTDVPSVNWRTDSPAILFVDYSDVLHTFPSLHNILPDRFSQRQPFKSTLPLFIFIYVVSHFTPSFRKSIF